MTVRECTCTSVHVDKQGMLRDGFRVPTDCLGGGGQRGGVLGCLGGENLAGRRSSVK